MSATEWFMSHCCCREIRRNNSDSTGVWLVSRVGTYRSQKIDVYPSLSPFLPWKPSPCKTFRLTPDPRVDYPTRMPWATSDPLLIRETIEGLCSKQISILRASVLWSETMAKSYTKPGHHGGHRQGAAIQIHPLSEDSVQPHPSSWLPGTLDAQCMVIEIILTAQVYKILAYIIRCITTHQFGSDPVIPK